MAIVQDPATGIWYDDAQTSAPVPTTPTGGTDLSGAPAPYPSGYGPPSGADPMQDPNQYDPVTNPGGMYTGGPNPYQPGPVGDAAPTSGEPPPTTPPPTAGPGPAPAPTPPPGGGGGGGGFPSGPPSGGISSWGPQFNAPKWDVPAPFSYKDFTAPTAEEAAAQPGYAFAASEGEKALANSQAAAGVYRTGGSLKDLYSWANRFATQNYGNVFGQDLSVYNTNRGNAADVYKTNLQTSRDAYDRTYQAALDTYRPQNQFAVLDFARQWDAFQAQLNAQQAILNAGAQ